MRLHAENPELSYEEVMELAMKLGRGVKLKEGEPRYQYECRSCGDEMWLGQELHNHYENNRINKSGFTIPKCGACWV